MTRWEYKVVSFESTGMMRRKFNFPAMEEELNQMGASGWEIVETKSVIANGWTLSFTVILKRPVNP